METKRTVAESSGRDPFDNCIIKAPDGVILGRCTNKKLNWYLDRGIATLECESPKTIVLNFEPSGRKGAGDDIHLTGKPNICVVCGDTKNLTRHHVVPWAIIRHMPIEYKCHNSHDVMALCVDCHHEYEWHSNEKRQKISLETGIKIEGTPEEDIHNRVKMYSISRAIVKKGEQMGPEKVAKLMKLLSELYGKEPSQSELIELTKYHPRMVKKKGFGEMYVERIGDCNAIAKEWRQHFVSTMNPQFIFYKWDVNRDF